MRACYWTEIQLRFVEQPTKKGEREKTCKKEKYLTVTAKQA